MLSHWQPATLGRFNVLLFFCWALTLQIAYAQLPTQANNHLTMANGLPHNTVMGVEQDRAGFIWIATFDGLARYDGRDIKVFRHRPGDTLSLANNKIRDLQQAADGTIVVNTESGTVQRFDPVNEQFTTLLHRGLLEQHKAVVNEVELSADGNHLWGLLPGVRLIDYHIQRNKLRVYSIPAFIGSINEVHDFILTPSGHIYGETRAGLLQYDTRTGHKRIFPFPFKPIDHRLPEKVGFWSMNRHQVTLGPNGEIAVFGYHVIALFDPVTTRFRTVPIPDVVKASIGNARTAATVVMYGLKTLADNQLYVGYMDRLYRLDDDRLVLIHKSANPTNRVVPWLIDRSGVLWISDGVLTMLDMHSVPFGFHPKKKSFSQDLLEEDLGVKLPKTFQVWDNENWPRYTSDQSRTGYLIDPFHAYRHEATQRTLTDLTPFIQINGQNCCQLCLKKSPQGRIWLYNNRRGLMAIPPEQTKCNYYPNSQLPLVHVEPAFDVGDIQPIGQSVWVGSQYELGLFRYDITQRHYDAPLVHNPQTTNSLPANSINCLAADPADTTVLWIGTVGGGLCRYDTRRRRFRRFGEAEGFPSTTIQSIEIDAQGMLWCATNRGLVRINPRTFSWQHFTTNDGLTEDGFSRTSSARLPDGRLVFGTANGRVVFDPLAIRDHAYHPPIVFSSLLINNKAVEYNTPTGRNTLSAPLNTLSELILDYTQNFLTIGFAGLHYGKAEKLNYRYKLVGVDANWVTVGQQNTANYTQLAPGRYLFSVNSTTADGRWSQQVKQLRIVITPPFWATWWAYLAYALAFGGLVLGFIRFRTRQIRQQQEIRLKQQEAEQLRAVDEIKTRFFANITHEFRTPLTLILSPIEKLVQQTPADLATRQTLLSVLRSGRQLLRLVNQLLDLSKLESGNMAISMTRGDAIAFIIRVAESLRPLAVSRQLTLHIDGDKPTDNPFDGPWLFDADKWEKIVINLLSNALKFTPAGGQVSMRPELPTADRLILHLTDTGVGIPAQYIPHIFDRFYQVDTSRTRAYEGTGIGLALVKELTDLLGGTITVDSRTEAPSGTTFILTLPLRPATDQADAPELIVPDTDVTNLWTIPTGRRASDLATPPVAGDAPAILVVDDNEELRTFIACELQDRYRVLTAANGEEGWDICQRELPDVVISDVMMPQLDGYQLTQRIKSTLVTNHLAVVLLTARAAHESRIAGLEQGADDYLTKPFHTDELALRLDNMLTRQANLRAHLHRQLVTLSVSDEPVADGFIRQLHQAIEGRLDDGTFGIDELARAVAMSRRTLNRKLTATANLSASDFIRHYRLQRATQMLRAGRSVSETAYGVGFESPSYFSTVFKQTYHQTPSEFVSHQQRA